MSPWSSKSRNTLTESAATAKMALEPSFLDGNVLKDAQHFPEYFYCKN